MFLVGNKCDMENDRAVSVERARQFQKEHDLKYVTEASAKSGDNVFRLFSDAAKFLYLRFGVDEDDGAGSSSSFAAGGNGYFNMHSASVSKSPLDDRTQSSDFGGRGQPPTAFKLVDDAQS